ncbi:MAG: UDP-N-acetyl-D-mannosamine dehydrogenase [Gammaproteobacteria bacterium]
MKSALNKISVIGLGYIGLPTAAILASRGIEVIGVDIDQHAVDTINRGEIHIIEPDLDAVVRSVVTTGKLRASTSPEKADAFLIAVPTPFVDEHQPDTSYIEAAIRSIAPMLEKGNLVVLESTSPVGTTEMISQWLAESRPDLIFPHQNEENADINVAYCPERVLPGQVLRELVNNDRVVGGLSPSCAESATKLYKFFVKGECVVTNSRTAEMCKLTENAYRDVNIAFANELSVICDKLKINVWELIGLTNRHPRVDILQPGPGVGGHCIAVDPWFIVNSAPSESKLIRLAREVNDAKPLYITEKVFHAYANIDKPKIALFGMTYKPNIDDFRESPSLDIVKAIANKLHNVDIFVVEPYAKDLSIFLDGINNVKLAALDEALEQANILVMLVDHDTFHEVPIERLSGKEIIDSRGCWAGKL